PASSENVVLSTTTQGQDDVLVALKLSLPTTRRNAALSVPTSQCELPAATDSTVTATATATTAEEEVARRRRTRSTATRCLPYSPHVATTRRSPVACARLGV